MMQSRMEHIRIAVIGAGIAGIAAARDLYRYGFRRIVIFESADRIGGRIHSVPVGNSWIELGAQWIHGQEDNVLYDYARSKGLIADPIQDHGREGAGHYCTEDGHLVDAPLVKKLIQFLDEQKNQMEPRCSANVRDFFRQKFQEFMEKNQREIVDRGDNLDRLLRIAYRWFSLFEVIDNSCDKLENLSVLSYTEWQDCPGVVDLVNFKHCYRSVLDEMGKEFPLNEFLQLQTSVTRIELVQNEKMVKLYIANNHQEKGQLSFDHVIITASLGFLKENLQSGFFGFKLPDAKIKIIQALGFSAIEKIFLWFDRPFWHEDLKGFQMLWSRITDEHSYSSDDDDQHHQESRQDQLPSWAYCIQGFDPVRHQPNMLMAWVGSYGALEMNRYTDMQLIETFTRILRKCVPRQCQKHEVEMPAKLFWHRWSDDPYIRGSYSNRTVAYEALKHNNNDDDDDFSVDALAQPVTAAASHDDQKPLVMFAGEATDRRHYSTTHGAMESGQREASRLYHYYSDF